MATSSDGEDCARGQRFVVEGIVVFFFFSSQVQPHSFCNRSALYLDVMDSM